MSIYVAKRGKRIGKTIMGSLYIHKSAISNLTEDEFHLYKTKLDCISELEFEFDVIKINFKDCEVSFIQSPDWDSANEPTVGDSICVKRDNSIRKTNGSNLIYHHKWMFVDDSYSGFSVSESKLRSELWMNHPYILALKADKDEKFNSKIGRRPYWTDTVCSIIGV